MHHDGRVIVLGAGFSSLAGHPVMAEFARTVIDLAFNYHNSLTDEERRRFQAVVDYRNQMRQLYAHVFLDLDNLEHLLGLLDMEVSLTSDETNQAIRDDLVFVLVKTLEMTYRIEQSLASELKALQEEGDLTGARGHRTGDTRHPSRHYRGFVEALRPHDVILTFNYDTALEDALLAANIAPDHKILEPRWLQTVRSQAVLKLHGSVNFIQREADQVEIVDFEMLTEPTKRYYELGRPLLVPPTWNKTSPGDTITTIWKEAWSAIRTARHLVFIGYSLPNSDLFFRYLLASALAKAEVLQSVKIVDLSEDTLRRYKDFFSEAQQMNKQKFEVFHNKFENAWPQALGLAP